MVSVDGVILTKEELSKWKALNKIRLVHKILGLEVELNALNYKASIIKKEIEKLKSMRDK